MIHPTVRRRSWVLLLTIALAWLLRANKLVGVPFVWISNPLTMGLIYLPNFWLGRWLLRAHYKKPNFGNAFSTGGGWRLEAWPPNLDQEILTYTGCTRAELRPH